MIKLASLDSVRLNHAPTSVIAGIKTSVTCAGEEPFAATIDIEWYEQAPDVIAMIVTTTYGKGVHELSRDLVHYALLETRVEFGQGDVRVMGVPETLLLVSIRGGGKNWWSHRLPAGSMAALMRKAARLSPMDQTGLRGPKPYAHTAGRP